MRPERASRTAVHRTSKGRCAVGIVKILFAAVAASGLPPDVHGATPQLKTQAPGFYRMMVGDFEITALSDGVFDLKTDELLTNIAPARRRELLERSFHHDALPTSVNAYLINTGDRLVLVDTGAAQRFGPTLGRLPANLIASGYRPEQVDTILITHMHPDHIGGLVAQGKAVFPNATVLVDRRDAECWLSATALAKASEDRRSFFEGAAASIAPYASASKLRLFEAPVDILPGIHAIPAPGHTPGHTLYSVESNGQRLVLWGDLTEVASIQFSDPTVTIAFDSDGAEASRQRTKAYADAADHRDLVGAAHLPFPGLGHVRREGAGYAWVPIDYDGIR